MVSLRIPYTWKNRYVFIKDGAWFAPDCETASQFSFSGWNDPELFAKEQPVFIEYCSGNGSWIIERAKETPHINWLAIEKRFCRAKRVWEKAKYLGLSNVAVVWGEGLFVTKQYFTTSSVSEVFVNFPDPWPKRRHAKNRIISKPFVEELARIIKPEGIVTLVTDCESYSQIMINEMLTPSLFKSAFETPHFIETPESYGTSFFDELFRGKNKTIRLHKFVRVAT